MRFSPIAVALLAGVGAGTTAALRPRPPLTLVAAPGVRINARSRTAGPTE